MISEQKPLEREQENSRTVSGLIIGDEILSGKVEEQNMSFLIHELRLLGVRLEAVHLLPDNVSVLAQRIREASAEHDFVITSGGLGPTHDDVTMEAAARAFDQELRQNEEYKRILANVYDEPLEESVKRMALLPEDIQFHWGEDLQIPTSRLENVFILPGEPRLFRSKFEAIRNELRTDTTFYCQKLYLRSKETEVADVLEDIQENHPDVTIGSYPFPWNDDYQELVTVESTGEYAVEKAVEDVLQRIPAESVVKREEE